MTVMIMSGDMKSAIARSDRMEKEFADDMGKSGFFASSSQGYSLVFL